MNGPRGDLPGENERRLILSELRDLKQTFAGMADAFVSRREYEARQQTLDDALRRIEAAVTGLRADLAREYVPRGEFDQALDTGKSERTALTRRIEATERDLTAIRERLGSVRGVTTGIQGMLGRQFDLFQVILGAAAGAFFYWLFVVRH